MAKKAPFEEKVWNRELAKALPGADSENLKMPRLSLFAFRAAWKKACVVRHIQTLKYCPIMKTFALLLLFCQLAFSADPPKFGWKKLGEETFSLDATAHKDFRLPKGRLLFQFKAEEAIYAGVATAEQYAPFKAGKYLELANFKRFHCVKTDLIEGVQQCNVTVSVDCGGAQASAEAAQSPSSAIAGRAGGWRLVRAAWQEYELAHLALASEPTTPRA